MALRYVMADKAYSSWSVRPWLVLKAFDIPFAETTIALDRPETRAEILEHSPTAKLPCLIDGDLAIWDSLAIIEYLAENYPDRGIWPKDKKARARARSACAEMHSGFPNLRKECPMNLRREVRAIVLSEEAKADVARIEALWRQCRERRAEKGPFLFGAFSAADAYFAPVANRLRVYSIEASQDAKTYMDALDAHPAVRELLAAAKNEPWRIAKYEAV
jgi:glutathione S-transferase